MRLRRNAEVLSIRVAWELVVGERCCCGKPEDRWAWVARSDEYPNIWASSDTAERSKELVRRLVRCREEGRVPTAREVRGLDDLEETDDA